MHAYAHSLLPEHDVYPYQTALDRVGLVVLTCSLLFATVWIGPHELIVLSWLWLGGWSTLKCLARRRERARRPVDEDEPT